MPSIAGVLGERVCNLFTKAWNWVVLVAAQVIFVGLVLGRNSRAEGAALAQCRGRSRIWSSVKSIQVLQPSRR